ncbi:hypothetical protein ABMA28_002548 [Loxostege sticticalis]|uniref:Uncharacterized protein n=1 Tax=Loxostege sticticalis TaxID=481309 RepID=A0ABD0SXE1_LOXSC
MACKLFTFLAVATLVAQGYGAVIEEIRLDDEEVNHISNPLIGRGISIPHSILDTLEACSVSFPNGMSFDVYPNNNLPSSVSAGNSVFPSCGINFRNPSVSLSGTYELTALTRHFDNRRTLQYKRFIINFTESELFQ